MVQPSTWFSSYMRSVTHRHAVCPPSHLLQIGMPTEYLQQSDARIQGCRQPIPDDFLMPWSVNYLAFSHISHTW